MIHVSQHENQLESLENFSAPISLDSNEQTLQTKDGDAQGQYYPQSIHPFGNVPEFLKSSYRHLSPQQEAYAQAMQNLRNKPESFAPDSARQKPCTHLSSEERHQALFRELLYYRDTENIRTRTNTRNFLFRFVQCFFCGLILFFWLAPRILRYL